MLGLCVNPTNFLFFQEQLCIAYCIKYELNRVTSTPSSFGSFSMRPSQSRCGMTLLPSNPPLLFFSFAGFFTHGLGLERSTISILTFSPGMGPRLTRVEILVDPVRPIW